MNITPEIKKGPMDSSNLLTLNVTNPNSSVSINNILDLNKGKQYPPTNNPTPMGSPAPARTAPMGSPAPARTTPTGSPAPARTAPTGSPAPVRTAPMGSPAPARTTPTSSPAPAAQPIVSKPLPTFLNPMRKGQKAPLSPTPISSVKACLGWNVNNSQCDLDVSAFLLSGSGKVIGDDWFVFYGQCDSPDQSVHFSCINDTSDREMIQIDLNRLNPSVEKIVFVLTINEALTKRLNFSMVKDAYVRMIDPATQKELVSYQMTEYYSNVISMMIGELYKHNGVWKFNAVGNGVARDLAGLCELYGVQVV